MTNEKDLNKIESLLVNSRNDIIYLNGSTKSCQELLDRQKKLIDEVKDEFQGKINEGKLNVDVANFCISYLNKISSATQVFLTEKTNLYYAKLGGIGALEACLNVLKESEKNEEKVVHQEEIIASDKRKRPDEIDQPMGKRLQDIKKRKRKT